jgi:hypothetical protein
MTPASGEEKTAYSLSQLKADLTIIEQSWKAKPAWWKAGVPLLLFGLPALLIIVQYSVITGTIPVNVTVSYIVLNYSHPNATAMFASNYLHSVWLPEHIVQNVAGYFAILYAAFVLYCIVIPILKMHGLLSFAYPDAAFFLTALVLLLGLPFAVSGISIYFGRMLSQTGSWGFSGIVYGFYAYLFFLGILIMYDLSLTRMFRRAQSPPETEAGDQPQDPPTPAGIALSLILITLVAVFSPVFVILNDIGNGTIGVFGHLARFALGFIIAVVVMLISERKLLKNRAALAAFLLLVIAVPAGIWIVV